jgi:hypothetical protein
VDPAVHRIWDAAHAVSTLDDEAQAILGKPRVTHRLAETIVRDLRRSDKWGDLLSEAVSRLTDEVEIHRFLDWAKDHPADLGYTRENALHDMRENIEVMRAKEENHAWSDEVVLKALGLG